MGNAVEELKARGWHVTGHQNEAGVAQAIERFVSEAGLRPPVARLRPPGASTDTLKNTRSSSSHTFQACSPPGIS